MSEIIKVTESFEKIQYSYTGNKLVDEVTIKCKSCKANLLHILVVGRSPMKHIIRATCPFCDSCSFNTEIDGKFQLGSCEGVRLGEIDENNGVEVIKCHKN